ncbi:MAG: DUF2244 domain-containing protein [Pseudomonadota bacterium]
MRGDRPKSWDAAVGEPAAVSASDPFSRPDPPVWKIRLWPYRSLSTEGFRWIMAVTAAGLALPLIALAPTGASFALAPYAIFALILLWLFLKLSYFTGRTTEELRLWPDVIAVERREPWGKIRRWSANPYWVDIDLADTRQVPSYLTLRGSGRRIELGAFLTPAERVELAGELRSRIAQLRRPSPQT